jgi:hypothetical protein
VLGAGRFGGTIVNPCRMSQQLVRHLVEPGIGAIVTEYELVAPGTFLLDESTTRELGRHPAVAAPEITVKHQFCALGEDAEGLLVCAAAIGNTRLGAEWVLLALGADHGEAALTVAPPPAHAREGCAARRPKSGFLPRRSAGLRPRSPPAMSPSNANQLKAATFPVVKALDRRVSTRQLRGRPLTTWLAWNRFGPNAVW